MTDSDQPGESDVTGDSDVVRVEYQAPHVEVLGTLADLTRGGTAAIGDGFGGAGSTGSI